MNLYIATDVNEDIQRSETETSMYTYSYWPCMGRYTVLIRFLVCVQCLCSVQSYHDYHAIKINQTFLKLISGFIIIY